MLNDNRYVDEAERDIYLYGLTLLKQKMLYGLVIFALAVLIGSVKETLMFYIIYTALRKFAGGYHASTKKGCFAVTVSITLTLIFFTEIAVPGYPVMIMTSAVLGIILMLGPQGSRYRRIDRSERRYFKGRLLMIIILVWLFSFYMFMIHNSLVVVIFYTILVQMLMQLHSYIKHILSGGYDEQKI